MAATSATAYDKIIESVFFSHYIPGARQFEFSRDELIEAANNLGVPIPKNPGDVLYSYRYSRRELPLRIRKTAGDETWTIPGAGRGLYRFVLRKRVLIVPNSALVTIKIPDATPGVIRRYAITDEQALLVKVRYNRLIDLFTGIVCYSLQNHLRTTVTGIGQVETDELYVGIDRSGTHYILPVQAKGGSDVIGTVQIEQDLALCAQKYPALVCRAIAAQFMDDDVIALFELYSVDAEIRIIAERHYLLVPQEDLSDEEVEDYRRRSRPPV